MNETKFLDHLNFPEGLKQLSQDDFSVLIEEIRQRLIEIGDHCGGHLGSNLGVVELTVALHTVFDSPKDKFIWDTSHQTYVHKMLTGRLDKMFTIRQDNGLSGFAKITESDHDIFGAGHASTSLSAALGVAQARDVQDKHFHVVSVIGDSSLPGGMAFEALNNIGKLKKGKPFICILNDNNMSISQPVGMMADYMTQVRTSQLYNSVKDKFERIFKKIPRIGEPMTNRIESLVERVRDIVLNVKTGVIFEEFGFKYLGPIDGHNLPILMASLRFAKQYPGPIMIHIKTVKGKGHQLAEENPVKYHGVSPKPKENVVKTISKPKFTQVFGKACVQLAKKDPDIFVVTPAMETGSGLVEYAQQFPDRYCDVGIAEEHAVTYCAGMARQGIKPILAIYSTFLQRGYDQLVHDVCIQKLPVIFALDRAGLVGEDGPTHHGVLDINFMLPIPNLTILAPKDGTELTDMVTWSTQQNKPISIRFSKSEIPDQDGQKRAVIQDGVAEVLLDSNVDKIDCLIIGVGSMAWPSYEAGVKCQEKGLNSVVINLRFIKPLDIETLMTYAKRAKHIFVVEEGQLIGGVFSYILSTLNLDIPRKSWHPISIPDEFVDHGKLSTLRNQYFLSAEGVFSEVSRVLNLETINEND